MLQTPCSCRWVLRLEQNCGTLSRDGTREEPAMGGCKQDDLVNWQCFLESRIRPSLLDAMDVLTLVAYIQPAAIQMYTVHCGTPAAADGGAETPDGVSGNRA